MILLAFIGGFALGVLAICLYTSLKLRRARREIALDLTRLAERKEDAR